MTREYKASTMV